MLAQLTHKTNLAEERNENRKTAEGRHCALGLAQKQPFIR